MYFGMCVFPRFWQNRLSKVATVTGFRLGRSISLFFGAVEARLLEPGAFFVCLQSKNGTCHVVSLESIDV